MVRITRVHTGGGDGGETSLLDGERVGKDHHRVAFYGTIDEVNSQVGAVRMELNRIEKIAPDGGQKTNLIRAAELANKRLGIIQQELFDIGGECSCAPEKIPKIMGLISEQQCDRLVEEMNEWIEDLEPLESFIIPTGSPPVANLHIARCVTRRAERNACGIRSIEGEDAVRGEVISYLNRLSDWLFVLGRWIAVKTGEEEVLWTPLGKRDA
ncbi:MAG: cob(I)yrinic acid a,c-diamide adenosyltransferase [Euryarchaeota archaeon]|jgi:cob(I)alamin adenosyltransferase|nr:cob(I)yrinic acid a,c-diamide adenosyltransferase [Euryarchaeota archaeon]MBT3654005.1 cob(I)yrinic acid a,c-diamide adenosyltransferase [Euryarchaeota archaeon]MBT3758197.1 cob(I)yrinic acid a,c-diamide adenosyltransferase [Euryarchaeota archaeon]MBT4051251.1 cob(I)yrinic acid a,c-diamide adenosyltransferase [Euryarchaeota archaeon]MBT4346030.1 cob(I)yrinic acid a,c-diamide adenosyltransferase [Euryarchaeota archaeon]|tara:strand:- start:381 stop:1016 length:636 start_codon:yes stop_codon:yes gene_type:complete